MSTLKEGAGWSFTCPCGWLTWNESQPRTNAAALTHQQKCDGIPPTPKHISAPKPRAKSDWNAREESTWIDKL